MLLVCGKQCFSLVRCAVIGMNEFSVLLQWLLFIVFSVKTICWHQFFGDAGLVVFLKQEQKAPPPPPHHHDVPATTITSTRRYVYLYLYARPLCPTWYKYRIWTSIYVTPRRGASLQKDTVRTKK
jgi:hypothetical protein